MAKKVAILGSTGSIGKSALDVIEQLSPSFTVWGLSANKNFEALARQAGTHPEAFLSLSDGPSEGEFRRFAPDMARKLLPQAEFERRAAAEADIVLVAVVGAAGLTGALAAAEAGKRLALANKESLVTAGELVMRTARENGGEVLPVDSEHSAVFQALHAGRVEDVSQIVITASGGPFLDRPIGDFDAVTVEEALSHPTWSMGRKITIDSATMANKAFEVIEARWLFDIAPEKIAVFVHPESIVHSMVKFIDGSVIAQLSLPDMRLPIQYALTYPERAASTVASLDLVELGTLTFRAPDGSRFPYLRVGFEVAGEGGTTGAVFNAANEVAVAAFLRGGLKFSGMYPLVRRVLDKHNKKPAD
ncbi:MAG: 1-deoxy-D-xylulose-5-phosphate reductoisomerase, partial [Planctomycetota bacterium]